MIRPVGGGFLYTDEEFEVMKSELLNLKEAGADGFVFGFLTEDNKVDKEKKFGFSAISRWFTLYFSPGFRQNTR